MRVYITGDGLDRHAGMSLLVTTGYRPQALENFFIDYGLPNIREATYSQKAFLDTQRMFVTHVHSDHFLPGDLFHGRWTRRIEPDRFDLYGPVGIEERTLNALNSSSPGLKCTLEVIVHAVDEWETRLHRMVYNGRMFVPEPAGVESTPADERGIMKIAEFGEGGHTTVEALYGFHGSPDVPVLSFAVKERKPAMVKVNTEALSGMDIGTGRWVSRLKDTVAERLDRYDGKDVVNFLHRELFQEGAEYMPCGVDEDGFRALLSDGLTIRPPLNVKLAYIMDTVALREDAEIPEALRGASRSRLMRGGLRANYDSLVELAQGADCLFIEVRCGERPKKGIHMELADVASIIRDAQPRQAIMSHMGMDHYQAPPMAGPFYETFLKFADLFDPDDREMTSEDETAAIKEFQRVYKGVTGRDINEESVRAVLYFVGLKMDVAPVDLRMGVSLHRLPKRKPLSVQLRHVAYRVAVPETDLQLYSGQ